MREAIETQISQLRKRLERAISPLRLLDLYGQIKVLEAMLENMEDR